MNLDVTTLFQITDIVNCANLLIIFSGPIFKEPRSGGPLGPALSGDGFWRLL